MKKVILSLVAVISLCSFMAIESLADDSSGWAGVEFRPVQGISHFVHSDIVNDDYEIRVSLPQG